jgi:hypothetical protein
VTTQWTEETRVQWWKKVWIFYGEQAPVLWCIISSVTWVVRGSQGATTSSRSSAERSWSSVTSSSCVVVASARIQQQRNKLERTWAWRAPRDFGVLDRFLKRRGFTYQTVVAAILARSPVDVWRIITSQSRIRASHTLRHRLRSQRTANLFFSYNATKKNWVSFWWCVYVFLFSAGFALLVLLGPVWYSFMSSFTSSFTTSIAKQSTLCPTLWSASLKTHSHRVKHMVKLQNHGSLPRSWICSLSCFLKNNSIGEAELCQTGP